jgi:hypothetical protein
MMLGCCNKCIAHFSNEWLNLGISEKRRLAGGGVLLLLLAWLALALELLAFLVAGLLSTWQAVLPHDA